MNNKKDIGDHFGKWKIILVVLSIFAAVKMLFFAFGLDEEYQLVMAYRNVKGDKLFLDMWEPHQSSAFLCVLLMRPYLAFFGETGVVIWLRLCGTLIHLGVSFYLSRVLRRMVSRDSAFLLGLIYFNTIPKQIMLPEFGIMQVWFLTLLSLFLIQYYDSGVSGDNTDAGEAAGNVIAGGNIKKRKYLVFSAFALVLEVLSYPSCLLLYLPAVWIIWRRSGKNRLVDTGIFTGVCAVCGMVYLGLLLRNNTLEGLFTTLSFIVNGDITHSLSFADKLVSLGKDILMPLVLCLGIFVLAFVLANAGVKIGVKGKEKETGEGERGEDAKEGGVPERDEEKFFRLQLIWVTALSCLVELWYWVVLNAGYEGLQIHLVVFAVSGVLYYIQAVKRRGIRGNVKAADDRGEREERTGDKSRRAVSIADREDSNEEDRSFQQKSLLLDNIILAGGALLAVLYLTDLGLMDSLPHAMTAAFFGMTLVVMHWEERRGIDGVIEKGSACVCIVLLLWAFTAVFGKGYTLRSGTGYHNVLQSGGILKHGPAIGTISDYMCAYIYNCDYEDWQGMVQDGDRVLIMVDQVMNLGTIQYLFKDVEVSHYSIVNPTAYDERLLDYWEQFPEKEPNVIIVDDWYGQLMTDPEGWLMRYAEGEFGYTSVEQGRYIRIYRKDSVS